VRELREETTIQTWELGIELVYSGFSARGRLVDTFLCRAYGGTPATVEGEGAVEWKPWPPSEHAGHLRGYYHGFEEAFDMRLRLYKAIGNEPPLSQRLGKSALEYVEEKLRGDVAEDVHRHLVALTYVMSEEEKSSAEIVLRDVLAPKLPEMKERVPEIEADGEDEAEPVFNNDEGREGP
jgi:hypothetical protein